jgi:hypothetical protein
MVRQPGQPLPHPNTAFRSRWSLVPRTFAAALFMGLSAFALAGGDQVPAPAAQAQAQAPVLFTGRTGPDRTRAAVSNTFYLELALGARELRICHSGVALGTYPMTALTVAYPRIFFFPRSHVGDWVDDIWTDARLDPEKVVQRLKIVPGDTATIPTPDKPGVVPPTMEELTPVPQDFALRCAGDRAIFIHLEGQLTGAVKQDGVKASRWDDFLEALGLKESEAIRLQATLSAADGAAFYRSFPDGTPQLFVLP